MDLFQIFNNLKPDVKKTTLDSYVIKIKKIYDGKPIKNFDLLLNVEYINKFLDKLHKNTSKRTYLTPILILLRDSKPDSDALKQYEKMNQTYRLDYQNIMENNIKTETQEKNWMSWNDILLIKNHLVREVEYFKSKKNLQTNKLKKQLDYALIASLYSDIPPSRLDFNNMNVYKNITEDELPTNENYILMNKKEKMKIVLNNYKTDGKYGKKIIIVPPSLRRIIKLYLRFHEKILPDMTENNLSKIIKKVFTDGDKSLSLNMLRHIYISDKVNTSKLKKNKQVAEAMGHSLGMQAGYAK